MLVFARAIIQSHNNRHQQTKNVRLYSKKRKSTSPTSSSPWATIGPHAPHPLSSVSGTILFRGLPRFIFLMLTEKKLGLTLTFGHFEKWPPTDIKIFNM